MRTHRLLGGLLTLASLSSAAWKVHRDAPDGWKASYTLSGISPENPLPVTARRLAIPAQGAPSVSAYLVGKDSVRTPLALQTRIHAWSGTRILDLSIPLSPAQRALKDIAARAIVVEAQWAPGSGGPLPSVVRSTVANPKGGAFFGPLRSTARLGATTTLSLPTGPALTVEIGDASKRNDRIVSRTAENGVFRLTGKDLRNLFGSLAGSSLRNLTVYRGPRDTLPRNAGSLKPPALEPVRIERISRNLDGAIQDDDEIRFYAEGTTVWTRDTANPCGTGWRLSASPYALSRRYLVALQPDGIRQPLSPGLASASPSNAAPETLPIQTWQVEKHMLLGNLEVGSTASEDAVSGANWYWQTLADTASVATGLSPVGIQGASACLDLHFAGSNADRYGVSSPTFLALEGIEATRISTTGFHSYWSLPSLPATAATLAVNGVGRSRLLSVALHASQLPRLEAGSVEFPAPSVGTLRLPFLAPSGLTDSLVAYALVDGQIQRRVALLPNPARDASGWKGWALADSATTLDTRYRITAASSLLSSGSGTATLASWSAPTSPYALTDFAGAGADSMLVLTAAAFEEQAETYARYRSEQSPGRRFQTRSLRVEDLYLLHSGGAADPTALRDFLRWSRANLGTSHVLLLGSALFDMRDLKKTGQVCHLPTWQSGNFASDNYFAYLDSAEWGQNVTTRSLDLHLGRIPLRSAAEFEAWFTKLKAYEKPLAGQDPNWRNTALLLADDYFTSDGGQFVSDGAGNHTLQTERLYESVRSARPWQGFSKVFVADYPYDANYRKPSAKLDLVARLNQGVSLFNYFGHGSGNQLTHEAAFDLEAVNSLTNSSMPFLFYAGACAVGRFDGYETPLGMTLLLAPGRGAMATISATRPTFSSPNENLNSFFFERIYDTLPHAYSLGEAFTAARNLAMKNEEFYATNYSTFGDMTNQEAYVLLGDPAMSFAHVGLKVSMPALPDTLKALQVFKQNGSVLPATAASVAFRIQGQAGRALLSGGGFSDSVTLSPKQILSATTMTTSGTFSIEALTPAKLEFGKNSSIAVFAVDQATGACGGLLKDSIPQSGSDTATTSDIQGPSILFTPCDSSYSAGQPFVKVAKIPLPFCLEVKLEDNAGISSASGPDEGTLVNLAKVWDTYRPDLKSGASYRQASFQLNFDSSKFVPGSTNQLSILTHDQMGNFSKGFLEVQIQQEDAVGLYDVFNRPNPIKRGGTTTFFFKVSSNPDDNNAIPSSVQAAVRIHTLSGKLIRVLNMDLTQEKALMPKATWDLKDAFGNELANGLYPYTVLLRVPGITAGSWRQFERRGVAVLSR